MLEVYHPETAGEFGRDPVGIVSSSSLTLSSWFRREWVKIDDADRPGLWWERKAGVEAVVFTIVGAGADNFWCWLLWAIVVRVDCSVLFFFSFSFGWLILEFIHGDHHVAVALRVGKTVQVNQIILEVDKVCWLRVVGIGVLFSFAFSLSLSLDWVVRLEFVHSNHHFALHVGQIFHLGQLRQPELAEVGKYRERKKSTGRS